MPRLIRRAAGRRRRRSSLLRPNSGVRTDRRGQCAREFSSLVDRRRCALAITDNADLLCLQQKRLANALSERASVSTSFTSGAPSASCGPTPTSRRRRLSLIAIRRVAIPTLAAATPGATTTPSPFLASRRLSRTLGGGSYFPTSQVIDLAR